MDLTGQTLLGKYEIEGLLGQGGMGAVWRARHALTGRRLAIKVLDESYLENAKVKRRFAREAKAASAVQHPGVVEILDIDETEAGVPFLVMEFLEGETLARRIERRGRLEQDELIRLGTMLLEALEAAHAHRVVHRDLKPENIYVVPAGRSGELVKIIDFGISQMVEEDGHKLTMTGSVLGTPHYMSPEQAMGDTEIDQRADLYAAGVLLYECAVGDVPYDAPNYNKLLRMILDQDPARPRERGAEIGPEVEAVILWAMDKERDRRIGSAREMIEWLERAAAGEAPPYRARSSVLPVRDGSSSTATPRPAGTLPANRGLRSSLGAPASISASPTSWRPLPPPIDEEDDLELDLDGLRRRSEAIPAELEAASATGTPPRRASAPPPVSDVASSWRSAAPSSPPPRPADRSGGAISGEHPASSFAAAAEDDDPLQRSVEDAGDLELELDESALPPRSIRPPGARPSGPAPAGVSGPNPALSESAAEAITRPSPIAPRNATVTGSYEARPPEPELDEPPAWRRYALFGLLGAGAFVGLVFLLNYLVQPGATEVADVAGDAPVPPTASRSPGRGGGPSGDDAAAPARTSAPRWVSMRVVGLPPQARMSLDGLPASNPFRLRHGGTHVLEITAPGYEDRRLEFEADRNRTMHAGMRPEIDGDEEDDAPR